MAQNDTEDGQERDRKPAPDWLLVVTFGIGVLATVLWVGAMAAMLGFVISAIAG